jgi:hypothetical protein
MSKKTAKKPGILSRVTPKPIAPAVAPSEDTKQRGGRPDEERVMLTYRISRKRHKLLLETAKIHMDVTVNALIDQALALYFQREHGMDY